MFKRQKTVKEYSQEDIDTMQARIEDLEDELKGAYSYANICVVFIAILAIISTTLFLIK